MRVPFLRSGPRRPTATELRAAGLALGGETGEHEAPGAGAASPELLAERDAMRSIMRTLECIPPQAWNVELGPAPAASRRGRLRSPLPAVAIAATLLVVFVLGSLTHPLTTAHRAHTALGAVPHVVLRPLPDTPANSSAVAYMPGGNRMVLTVKNLARSAPGTFYELWLMSSKTDLVPVTSFRVTARADGTLQLVLPATPSHYRYLDISIQRVGGGSAISRDNVLRGVIPS